MTKLTRDTNVVFIHGQTGQEVSSGILPAGTDYTVESVENDYQFGKRTILRVGRERYATRDLD